MIFDRLYILLCLPLYAFVELGIGSFLKNILYLEYLTFPLRNSTVCQKPGQATPGFWFGPHYLQLYCKTVHVNVHAVAPCAEGIV